MNTTDGGGNWFVQNSGTTVSLYSIYYINSNTAVVTGAEGKILKTTDSGQSWNSLTSGTSNDLYAVTFYDENSGTAVGDGGIIIRTTNSGINWSPQNSGTSNYLFSVSFSDQNMGTAVGDWGTILRTTDGGTNWTHQMMIAFHALRDVYLVNDSIGYICGGNGTIVKTTNGGIVTEVEETTNMNYTPPKDYLLLQNYPNPFNPITEIKFTIPSTNNPLLGGDERGGLVTLTIFDVLGNEITTLVNEEKPKGTYDVEFDGTGLPS